MIRIETYCRVKKGELKIINSRLFKENIKGLPDGNYTISIEKRYNKRSNPQNAYLWGVVYPIVKEGLIDAGFDEFKQDYELEMTHELCKLRFLKKELIANNPIPQLATSLQILGSTKELTTTDFMEYLANIQKWSSEYLGVYIPEPDTNYERIEMSEL
jgi:hypothetical protein